MHPPLIHTPMMRIGFKKSAIVSLLALAGASAILPGCKRPQELLDAAADAKLEKSQEDLKAAMTQIALCKRAHDYYAFRDAYLARHNVKVVPEVLEGKGPKAKEPAEELPSPYPSQATLPAAEKKAEADLLKAVNDLTTAAQDKAIAPSILANAKMAAGNAECILADTKLSRIEDKELQIQHLLTLIKALTGKLQANNLTVQALQTNEPKPIRDNLQKSIDSVTGDKDHPVWELPALGSVGPWRTPAQAALEAQTDDLSKQIAALNAEKTAFQGQIDEATTQARQLEQESEHSTGKKSYDLFDNAANLRKKAGETEVLIKNDLVKIASLQHDLDIATAQLETLKNAVKVFKATDQTFADAWTPLKTRIDAIMVDSQGLVGAESTGSTTAPSDPAEPTTITAAFEQIDLKSKELDGLRAEAKAHLEKADHLDGKKSHTGLFADAAELDKKVSAEYQPFVAKPEWNDSAMRPAWQWMIEIHNDADPTLQEALVQQRLARLYADQAFTGASIQAAIVPLVDVLAKANVTTPSKLASQEVLTWLEKLKGPSEEARKAAEQAFNDSDEYLTSIIPSSSAGQSGVTPLIEPETKRALVYAARVAKVIELFGHAAFLKAFEDPKAPDPKAADFIGAAKAEALKLTTEGVPLPIPLPAEIAPPPGVATAKSESASTPPTSQPATPPTAPATAPADTPTTAPAAPTAPTTQGAG